MSISMTHDWFYVIDRYPGHNLGCKIGITHNVKGRRGDYDTIAPESHVVFSLSTVHAPRLEKQLLKRLEGYRVKNQNGNLSEVIKLPKEQLIVIAKDEYSLMLKQIRQEMRKRQGKQQAASSKQIIDLTESPLEILLQLIDMGDVDQVDLYSSVSVQNLDAKLSYKLLLHTIDKQNEELTKIILESHLIINNAAYCIVSALMEKKIDIARQIMQTPRFRYVAETCFQSLVLADDGEALALLLNECNYLNPRMDGNAALFYSLIDGRYAVVDVLLKNEIVNRSVCRSELLKHIPFGKQDHFERLLKGSGSSYPGVGYPTERPPWLCRRQIIDI